MVEGKVVVSREHVKPSYFYVVEGKKFSFRTELSGEIKKKKKHLFYATRRVTSVYYCVFKWPTP